MKNSLAHAISLIIIPVLLCSCSKYYMVYTQTPSTPQQKTTMIDSLNKQRKYFLMHTDSAVYSVNDISVDTSALTITGLLTGVPEEHSLYLHPHRHFIWGPQKVYYKSEAGIINEVHLYTANPVKDSSFSIPTQNIQKIETIEYNKKKTTTANTVGIVVVIAGVVALVVAFIGLSQW